MEDLNKTLNWVLTFLVALACYVFYSVPKTTFGAATTHKTVITGIRPPKHFYITINYEGKTEEIFVAKHFNEWRNHVWIGKTVDLTKRQKTSVYPKFSLYTFSSEEKTEITYVWENVQESLKN